MTYAESLLDYFVQKFQSLYGYEYLSYNVHALLHLADDVRNFGELDNFSAAKFENNLQKLKKLVQGNHRPLQQIVRRFSETGVVHSTKNKTTRITVLMPDVSNKFDERVAGDIFRKVVFPSFVLISSKLKKSDCYFKQKDGSVLEFRRCVRGENGIKLVVKKFLVLDKFFASPCDSTELGIYRADLSQMSSEFVIDVSAVDSKFVGIPYNKPSLIIIPMLHC